MHVLLLPASSHSYGYSLPRRSCSWVNLLILVGPLDELAEGARCGIQPVGQGLCSRAPQASRGFRIALAKRRLTWFDKSEGIPRLSPVAPGSQSCAGSALRMGGRGVSGRPSAGRCVRS